MLAHVLRAPPPRRRAHEVERIRDLLGVVRALYAAAVASGAPLADRIRLARVGYGLREGLKLLESAPAGSESAQRGRELAAAATRALDGLTSPLAPAGPLVEAAVRRVVAPAETVVVERAAKKRPWR